MKKGSQLAPLMSPGAAVHGPCGESAIRADAIVSNLESWPQLEFALAPSGVTPRSHWKHCLLSPVPMCLRCGTADVERQRWGLSHTGETARAHVAIAGRGCAYPKIHLPEMGSRAREAPWHHGSTTTDCRTYGPPAIFDVAITQRELECHVPRPQ